MLKNITGTQVNVNRVFSCITYNPRMKYAFKTILMP